MTTVYTQYIVIQDTKGGWWRSAPANSLTRAVTPGVDHTTIRGSTVTSVFLVGIKEWEFAEINPKAYDALQKAMITTEGKFVEV